VTNLTDVVSINHNWFNGWSLPRVWSLIKSDLNLAENTLKEFSAAPPPLASLQCYINQIEIDPKAVQSLMKANTGVDCEGFLNIIHTQTVNLLKFKFKPNPEKIEDLKLDGKGTGPSSNISACGGQRVRKQKDVERSVREIKKILSHVCRQWPPWISKDCLERTKADLNALRQVALSGV